MDEALIKRVQPHSIEAEQSVIGAMLLDKDAIVEASEIVKSEDFYAHQYGLMFESMLELYNEGKPVDFITLQERLKKKDLPVEILGIELFRDLINAVPTSANIKHYATIVAEKAMLRKIIKVNEEITNSCYIEKDGLDTILEDTERKIFQLVQNRNSGDFVPIKDVVIRALEKIEQASKQSSLVTGIPTGFVDLDYKTTGLQPSDFILLGARPAMGKTAFVLNLADHISVQNDVTTVIFSLEMSKEQLINRVLSMESRVDAQKIRSGDLNDDDWEKLIESAGVIGKSRLIIDDTPSITITELRSKCRKYKLEHNLGLVIIDYLQLMSGSGKSDSRQQEVAEISRSLKGLAREIYVPIIACAQVNRACESRPDKRPMMSDLRESGSIEQDADMVMFLYRDDYYNKDSEQKGILEVIIAKQRNGPIGTVNLAWLPNLMRYANLEQ